jgi:hypothetical protein
LSPQLGITVNPNNLYPVPTGETALKLVLVDVYGNEAAINFRVIVLNYNGDFAGC